MKPRLSKVTYNKQATTIFALLFAAMAIMGFVSILTPQGEPTSQALQVTADAPQQVPMHNTYSGYLLRVVVVTLVMIVVLIMGLRLYNKQLKLKGKNNLDLIPLGKHYLNDKQYLLKVKVEDRNILLGVSETSINFITELDGDDDPEIDKPSFGTVLDLETNQETKL